MRARDLIGKKVLSITQHRERDMEGTVLVLDRIVFTDGTVLSLVPIEDPYAHGAKGVVRRPKWKQRVSREP